MSFKQKSSNKAWWPGKKDRDLSHHKDAAGGCAAFDVIKVNNHGKKQQRTIAVSKEGVSNLNGPNCQWFVKNSDVYNITQDSGSSQKFTLTFLHNYHFEAETPEQAKLIVAEFKRLGVGCRAETGSPVFATPVKLKIDDGSPSTSPKILPLRENTSLPSTPLMSSTAAASHIHNPANLPKLNASSWQPTASHGMAIEKREVTNSGETTGLSPLTPTPIPIKFPGTPIPATHAGTPMGAISNTPNALSVEGARVWKVRAEELKRQLVSKRGGPAITLPAQRHEPPSPIVELSKLKITSHTLAAANKKKKDKDKNKKKLTITDFELLKVLGVGSFGRVFLVKKKDSGKLYAMKVLNKREMMKKKQIAHTHTEKMVLSTMDHPFIVRLHFAFQSEECLFMKAGRFPEELSKFYIAEVITSLEYLHSNDIIYRDIKPENILLDAEGHIKLTDFGLSKSGITSVVGKSGDGQFATTFCGTPEYLAPEIITGAGHGKAADWWSVGNLRLPLFLSPESQDLLEKLLVPDPKKRLGTGGVAEIQNHPFFELIPWRMLESKMITPPFKPTIKEIVPNKDDPDLNPAITFQKRKSSSTIYDSPFTNFSWTKEENPLNDDRGSICSSSPSSPTKGSVLTGRRSTLNRGAEAMDKAYARRCAMVCWKWFNMTCSIVGHTSFATDILSGEHSKTTAIEYNIARKAHSLQVDEKFLDNVSEDQLNDPSYKDLLAGLKFLYIVPFKLSDYINLSSTLMLVTQHAIIENIALVDKGRKSPNPDDYIKVVRKLDKIKSRINLVTFGTTVYFTTLLPFVSSHAASLVDVRLSIPAILFSKVVEVLKDCLLLRLLNLTIRDCTEPPAKTWTSFQDFTSLKKLTLIPFSSGQHWSAESDFITFLGNPGHIRDAFYEFEPDDGPEYTLILSQVHLANLLVTPLTHLALTLNSKSPTKDIVLSPSITALELNLKSYKSVANLLLSLQQHKSIERLLICNLSGDSGDELDNDLSLLFDRNTSIKHLTLYYDEYNGPIEPHELLLKSLANNKSLVTLHLLFKHKKTSLGPLEKMLLANNTISEISVVSLSNYDFDIKIKEQFIIIAGRKYQLFRK
eukprot:gene17404-20763_t